MKQLAQWHKTKAGLLVFAAIELGLAYLFGSLAVNSGSLWEWALAIILFIGTVQNFVRIFFANHGNNKH